MLRETAIFLVQLLHTLVFFGVAGLVLYVLRCGIVGRASRRLLITSIVLPTLVGLLWLINGHECVLSTIIYALAGDRTRNDILLPVWFARWIMPGTSIVLTAAVCLVAWRQVVHKWRIETD